MYMRHKPIMLVETFVTLRGKFQHLLTFANALRRAFLLASVRSVNTMVVSDDVRRKTRLRQLLATRKAHNVAKNIFKTLRKTCVKVNASKGKAWC